MAGHGVPVVQEFTTFLEETLQRAEQIKQTSTIEPPLVKSDFPGLLERAQSILSPASSLDSKRHIVETSARDTFNNLLATTTIDSPSFVKLWNLLDIVTILSDEGQTEPGLLFWLVEELLESQTIAACRKIFDFLESRRERITVKDFEPGKKLVILRSCNELLRRLSRAEDTAFCGRVFIFLFQSFPLGDKSSVNLRGEYHVENVTTFDSVTPENDTQEKMEIDTDSPAKPAPTNTKDAPNSTKRSSEDNFKGVTFSKQERPIPVEQLYPMFWSLQRNFNQPKTLFDPAQFAAFKSGLEATMVMFRSVQSEGNTRPIKATEDTKRGTKRKRSQEEDDLANAFNPKYLTSKDLFELEISDLSFRRHILVQVLIILDFLLSLSTKAKEKLAKATLPDNANKSVMYADQTMSEEDSKWAHDMKKSIAEYLRVGMDGAFFYRMVETVLARDKNWVRWKIENCPSIAKPSISPKEYVDAKAVARKHSSKRVRVNNRSGTFDLGFLAEGNAHSKLDRLKEKLRYQLPSVEGFEGKIADDDFDIDRAIGIKDVEAKNATIEAKFSKSWRALRVASTHKLVSFDKIERSDKIDEIFKEQVKPEEPTMSGDDDSGESKEPVFPKDRRPIVVSGPSGVGKGTLIKMLLEKHNGVIGRKASHTTRKPREGEIHGMHYYFIDKEEYDIMRDGDQYLEFNNFNGNDYGTSRKVVEGIIAQGKVPIMEMDYHGIQQLKDQNYPARFIFLAPPEMSELERRLRQRGLDDAEKVKARLEIAKEELEKAKVEGFHDVTFVNDDLESTYKDLESYIFGFDVDQVDSLEGTEIVVETSDNEVEMTDGSTPIPKASTSNGEVPTPDVA